MSIGPIAWDENAPVGATDPMSSVDDELRGIKTAARRLLEVEHYPFADEKAGEHKQGSARALVDTAANLGLELLPPIGKIAYATDQKALRVTTGAAGEFVQFAVAPPAPLTSTSILATQFQVPSAAIAELVWNTGEGVNQNPRIPLVEGAGPSDFELDVELVLAFIKYDTVTSLNWAVWIESSIDARATFFLLDSFVGDSQSGAQPLLYRRQFPFDPTKNYDFRVLVVASLPTQFRINYPGAGLVPASSSRFSVTRRGSRLLGY